MSEDRHAGPPPQTTASMSGPSTSQPQIMVTGTAAFHAPTPTTAFPAPASAPPTPPHAHEPTGLVYAPATPPAIHPPPRAASHPSLRRPSVPGPMRHTVASLEDAATLSGYRGLGTGHPLPMLPHEGRRPTISEAHTVDGRHPGIDFIVPALTEEKPYRERTVGVRLQPTLTAAIIARDEYARKAQLHGYTLNAAIGLQILLGALTTGLSAATTGKNAQIATVTLGGLATLVASYLARARGSGEPDLSNTRVKDLEQFIRTCQAFILDRGYNTGDKYDHQLETFRHRFEEILGNTTSPTLKKEQQSSPV